MSLKPAANSQENTISARRKAGVSYVWWHLGKMWVHPWAKYSKHAASQNSSIHFC